jgi:hypothetical protein
MNLGQSPVNFGPWRHVVVRPNTLPGASGTVWLVWQKHNSKITQHELIVFADKNIRRFDIPMNDSLGVKSSNSFD